ncbi:chromate resistance protein ChrB domain-containing protein [Streptomyces sp. NPDC058424]|uniref:chromate resistance protein ChrB domain-containing protein n=1 Tax=Streptomyces sp. NPDC058424 TaxID=3346491 RepID=UPI003655B0D4
MAADAPQREYLEWAADEAIEAGGAASIWIARPATLTQERELATGMADARAAEYQAVIDQATQATAGYDAPETPGLDVVLRGLSMICDDERILELTGPVFDGLYEYHRRATLIGHDPA